MRYLCGTFDNRKFPPKILLVASYNSDTSVAEFLPIFQKGTGITLHQAIENLELVKQFVETENVILSDFKSFVGALNLDYRKEYRIYDCGLPSLSFIGNLSKSKLQAAKCLAELRQSETNVWSKILAQAQIVYSYLENKGYYHNNKHCRPFYDLTYSGRSKCSKNNIQGSNDHDVIEPTNEDHDWFVHFDWIAADLRAASIMSNDQYLMKSFIDSDPYTMLHQDLNSSQVSREDCKKQLLGAIYSLNYDGLECYQQLAKWMRHELSLIESHGYSKSILGKKFELEDNRTYKSVFNAKIQGSVAHAMQSVLYKVFQLFPDNIIAEVHDSLILASSQAQLKEIINSVSNIMLRPLEGYLESNPTFPLKVSVGKKWRQWKFYREYR